MRMGIDLGGTKIEGVVLDAQGRERMRKRIPTPRSSYQATLEAIEGLIRGFEQEMPELRDSRVPVGIGTPGALSKVTGRIKNANSTCLIGEALDADLASRLGRPVRIANDANCFALSEAVDGAASGAEVVFGVILGTGVGGGLVVRQRVLSGVNSIAGEWGHNPLPWPRDAERPGPMCYCGKSGCIEAFLSGGGLAQDYLRETGTTIAAPEIADRALVGESAAEACMQRYEDRLARALAHVMNIIDPDVIVCGGGVSNMDRIYKNVPLLWGKYVFTDDISTKLVRAKYGDSSGVRGAAWLWPSSIIP